MGRGGSTMETAPAELSVAKDNGSHLLNIRRSFLAPGRLVTGQGEPIG